PIGLALGNPARHRRADRRVVDRLEAVGADVVDVVTELLQRADQVLLQLEAGVVGPDGDAHQAVPLTPSPSPPPARPAGPYARPAPSSRWPPPRSPPACRRRGRPR